ncbi:recombinase family protein [Paenibacillus thailandensis]|uniref:Recombinase family protein n=1 Tax=Paenibacillus thailandensis TaxID=393250 RepID=A0ABW5R3D0_9BACL
MRNKRARGYVRVSTMKESQKDSPEHQEGAIKDHAKTMNMDIDYFYEDRDTATSIVARSDVQRMIEDAKKGEFDTLFFSSLSRFSRDALDALSLKRILVNALNVRVISIEDFYDSGTDDNEMLFGIVSVVNQKQSEQIGTSSKRGIRQSAAKGNYIGSIPPYGYKKVVVDGRKTLEIVPEQANIVKQIFDKYVNGGLGEKAITNWLNENDIPSYKGGTWGITSIQRILQNEIYTGFNVYGRHTVKKVYNDLNDLMDRGKKLVQKPKQEWQKTEFQTHPAIIGQDFFDRAQEVRSIRGGGMGRRGGRRAFVNVFAKMIFCSECGSAMVTMQSKVKGKGKEYRYLMCSRRRRMGEHGCSNGKWIPYFDFRDDLIKEILRRTKARIEAIESSERLVKGAISKTKNNTKDIKKLESLVESNRKLLFEIRRQYMLNEIDSNQYEFEKAQYEKEISDAESKIKEIRKKEAERADTDRLKRDAIIAMDELTKIESYDKDIQKTRLLLAKLVDRIDIKADGEVEVVSPLV